ncbi:hypothetical protein [Neorhizobium galegae]|uniref:Transglycosylase domain protein n=1 Tax=Neorhizobium galegae bv. orientalis str. HAMBI 540 TaxID=1028800 RepID=A0A068SMR3_NEOGA|nr:hypothetical protein [Neorhizobium galegae]CDN47572.1 Transglycosylase domain protein [Neorhizobium galegae bv. orientalis str. HAMBI 540]
MASSNTPAWLRYSNGAAKRNLPLDPRLVNSLGFLEDMGIQMEVFSGGQVTKAEAAQGKGSRTGSVRHDHGGAADVFFYKDGRKLDWARPEDVPVFQDIVRKARASGVTGFGAGQGYMQPGSMHIGFGSPTVWGANGDGANAPKWLSDAFHGVPATEIKEPTRLTFSNPGPDQPQSNFTVGSPENTVSVMSSTQPVLPTTMEEDRAAAQAREDALPDTTIWQGVKDAVNTDWSLSAIWQDKPEAKPDPNFRLDPKTMDELTKGIPEQYWDRFGDAQSLVHAEGMRNSLVKQMEAEQRLASLGWGGVGLRVAAGVTDPLAWAAAAGISAATLGTGAPAAVAARFGKVGQVALTAAEGGAGAAVSEGILYANQPTAEEADLWWGVGTGMLLGGAFGALAKNPATLAEAQQFQKIGRNMHNGTAMSPPGGSTAGAMQVNPREPLRLDTADIVRDAERPDVFDAGGLRFDSSYSLKSSENDLTSMIGNVIVEDAARNKSGITPIGASEVQALLHGRAEAKWASSNQANWKQFRERNPDASRDEFHQQVTAYVRDHDLMVDYDPAVKAQGAVLKDILGTYAETAANPGVIDGRTMRAVRGFEGLTRNDHYVPRIFDLGSIQDHLTKFGHKTLSGLVSRAMREVNDEITEELADTFAYNYIKKLHSLSAGELQQMSRAFSGEDLDALKANLIQDTDLSEADIDTLIGHMKPGKKDGASRHGKSRMFYDENFGAMLPYSNGETGAKFVRISDLFINDADTLLRSYSRQMSGRIAMARMEIKNPKWQPGDMADEYFVQGVTSDGEWNTLMDKVRDVGDQKGIQGKTKQDVDRLNWVYNTIVGKPTWNEGSDWNQFLRMARDYNFVRVMGQVGFAQLSEAMNTVSQLGLKASFTNVPSFRAMWRNAKTGKLDDALAQEWEDITGGGADWVRHATHRREDVFDNPLDTWNNPVLEKVDDFLHQGKRAVSAMSGMAPVNTALQRWTGRSIMNKFALMAQGRTKMNPRRLEALALDERRAEAIYENIRNHATFDKGRLKALNLDKWADREAVANFETAAFRLSRSIIQENDIGQMAMWMSAPLARTFLQFRSFVLAAYTKQTLQGLNFRDTATAAAFLTTTFAASMSYMMRTYAGSVGRSDREKYLEERLSLGSLAAAGIQNSSWASVMPMAIDTLASPFREKEHPIFDARSTGLGSDAIFGNPSADLVDSSIKVLGVAGQSLHGKAFSQADARTLARVLPFQNLNGIAQLLSTVISPLPEWSPKK